MPIDWFQTRRILGASASLFEKKLAKIYLKIEKIVLKGKVNWIEFYNYVDELVEKGDYQAFVETAHYYYGIDLTEMSSIDGAKRMVFDEVCFQTQNPFLIKLKRLYDQKQVYQVSYEIYSSDNNKIQLQLSNPLSSTYSTTGLTSSFSLTRVNDIIYMNVLDHNLHSVNIEKTVWATQSGIYQPVEAYDFQQFYVGTYSGYKSPTSSIQLDVPTTVVRDYQISVEVKNGTFSWYQLNHKLSVKRDTLIGQVKEVELLSPDAEYYLKNSQYSKLTGTRKTYLEVYKRNDLSPTGFDINPLILAYDNPSFTEDQNLIVRYTQAIDFLNS